MLLEASLQAFYLSEETIDTIYFGGGTPSLMQTSQIQRIFEEIEKNYPISMGAEITLEVNPDDINEEFLLALKETPVNRISIGTQSFNDKDLKYLNRRHDAKQAIRAVEKSIEAGYTNLSIDLIYGIPGQTMKSWKENLAQAIKLNVPHISAYCLTVEPGTKLDQLIQQKKSPAVDEALSVQMFDEAIDTLEKNGFIHYEISNYSKEGWHSRHNSSYWEEKKYLGLGPSAHSYNTKSRQWNVSSLKEYIENLESGKLPATLEELSETDLYNEYIMTSLRTIWGVSEDHVKKFFNKKIYSYFRKVIALKQKEAMVELKGNSYILTRAGKRMCDAVVRELFYDGE
jgi:oxygen-independent coproporphyrinogen-3 oxidase